MRASSVLPAALLTALLLALVAPSTAAQLPGLGGSQAAEDAAAEDAGDQLPDWMPQAARAEWLYLDELLSREVQIRSRNRAEQVALAGQLADLEEAGADADAVQAKRAEIEDKQVTEQLIQARIGDIEQRQHALTSFFAWPNPMHWARSHAAAVGLLILVWLLGLWAIGFGAQAIVRQAEKERKGKPADAEAVQRTLTLVTVFRKTLRFLLGVVLFVMLLGEFGVNTTAVVAGLGLLGLAISFGSQSLVKDLISGFFMLLEGQLAIGDVVALNGTTGTVENFTLRVTQLRDASGAVHFLPNGTISEVTNMTHEFSKAIISVGASYREDPDEVMRVLRTVLDDFAADPDWKQHVLEEPVILGVDALGESDIAFKMAVKVTPGQQWAARREVLRRVKIAFDLNDIEIPFPQRVTYAAGEQPASKVLARHRKEGAPPVTAADREPVKPVDKPGELDPGAED